jgi:hypothetical protein
MNMPAVIFLMLFLTIGDGRTHRGSVVAQTGGRTG